ncbi:helix-turn-helix transcriptional regulator, partial [Pseudomonas sp. O11]|uniref:helix-turn-helix transcriptional regulator n=1 Tax=Pseudomonas sp. O11 TaxID=3159446 RepID=UPI00387B6C16
MRREFFTGSKRNDHNPQRSYCCVTTQRHEVFVMQEHSAMGVKVLRVKQLCACLGLSRSTIYDRINPESKRYDDTFP